MQDLVQNFKLMLMVAVLPCFISVEGDRCTRSVISSTLQKEDICSDTADLRWNSYMLADKLENECGQCLKNITADEEKISVAVHDCATAYGESI